MLDLEDFPLGRQDKSLNRFYPRFDESPSPTMDMLLSANDSLSFQEMLDVDIKNEIDHVLGGHGDFTAFGDLPPLDLEDSPADINMWFTTGTNNSNSSFNIDFIGSEAVMVNPNSVMPLLVHRSSPVVRAKTPPAKTVSYSPVLKLSAVKKEEKKYTTKTIKIASPIIKTGIKAQELKGASILNVKTNVHKFATQVGGLNTVKVVAHGRKQSFSNNRLFVEDEKAYPKPAYSYSCLIAMALKNSRTGSLPVSEIYNFMCEHFPYFKTAPNGWKNSVRHNLSLNKCFEKIDKPAMSGAQRKGCLWAMNPAKVEKMDEEVQKWSRKDPVAIRRAMINPEHLELLERGELKYSCSSEGEGEAYGDSSGDAESDATSDVEIDQEAEVVADDFDFVDMRQVTTDEEGYDIEVANVTYENDTESEQEILRVEMELAEQELLEYHGTPSKKRSRSILELDDINLANTKFYEVQTTGRRKTAYILHTD